LDIQSFIDNGLASKNDLIKVLGEEKLKAAIKITAHKFSKSAQHKLQKSGGEAITL
jgi:large subunit ribosomal protein L15